MTPLYFMAIGMLLICIPILFIFRIIMKIDDRLWEIENFIYYLSTKPDEEADHGKEE